jgi:hypothetical protein
MSDDWGSIPDDENPFVGQKAIPAAASPSASWGSIPDDENPFVDRGAAPVAARPSVGWGSIPDDENPFVRAPLDPADGQETADQQLQTVGQIRKVVNAFAPAEDKVPLLRELGGDLGLELEQEKLTGEGEMTPVGKFFDSLDFALAGSVAVRGAKVARGIKKAFALFTTRPVFSALSVVSDMREFQAMPDADRRAFVESLPEDDPRRSGYAGFVDSLERLERNRAVALDPSRSSDDRIQARLRAQVDDTNARRSGLSVFWAYILPNRADPYGGTGLARPGVDGGQPDDSVGIAIRALAAGADDERRRELRAWLQKASVPVTEALVSLGMGAWETSGDLIRGRGNLSLGRQIAIENGKNRYRAAFMDRIRTGREEIEAGDEYRGSLLLNMAAQIAPELAVSKLLKADFAAAAPVKTSRGVLTGKGDEVLAESQDRALTAWSSSEGRQLEGEALEGTIRSLDAATAQIGDMAEKGRLNVIDIDYGKLIDGDGNVLRGKEDLKRAMVLSDDAPGAFYRAGTASRAYRGAVVRLPEWALKKYDVAQRTLSKGLRYGRLTEEGVYVPLTMEDVLGPHRWAAMRKHQSGKQAAKSLENRETIGMIEKLYSMAPTKKARQGITVLLEAFGREVPADDVEKVVSFIKEVRGQLSDLLTAANTEGVRRQVGRTQEAAEEIGISAEGQDAWGDFVRSGWDWKNFQQGDAKYKYIEDTDELIAARAAREANDTTKTRRMLEEAFVVAEYRGRQLRDRNKELESLQAKLTKQKADLTLAQRQAPDAEDALSQLDPPPPAAATARAAEAAPPTAQDWSQWVLDAPEAAAFRKAIRKQGLLKERHVEEGRRLQKEGMREAREREDVIKRLEGMEKEATPDKIKSVKAALKNARSAQTRAKKNNYQPKKWTNKRWRQEEAARDLVAAEGAKARAAWSQAQGAERAKARALEEAQGKLRRLRSEHDAAHPTVAFDSSVTWDATPLEGHTLLKVSSAAVQPGRGLFSGKLADRLGDSKEVVSLGSGGLQPGKMRAARKFMGGGAAKRGVAVRPARAGVADGKVVFDDGRHRVWAAGDLGQRFVLVAVRDADVGDFKRLVGGVEPANLGKPLGYPKAVGYQADEVTRLQGDAAGAARVAATGDDAVDDLVRQIEEKEAEIRALKSTTLSDDPLEAVGRAQDRMGGKGPVDRESVGVQGYAFPGRDEGRLALESLPDKARKWFESGADPGAKLHHMSLSALKEKGFLTNEGELTETAAKASAHLETVARGADGPLAVSSYAGYEMSDLERLGRELGGTTGPYQSQLSALGILADIESATSVELKRLTGFASPEEARVFGELQDKLRKSQARAAELLQSERIQESLRDFTLADINRAAEAVTRVGGVEAALKLQPAVRAVSEHLEGVLERLRAAGVVDSGLTMERFLENKQVRGYVPHILNKAKRAAGGARGRQRLGGAFEFGRTRTRTKSIAEENEGFRRESAKEYLRGQGLGDEAIDAPGMVEETIVELGLDKLEYFESDIKQLIYQYGTRSSRAIADAQFTRNMSELWPEGDEFAALSKREILKNNPDLSAVDLAEQVAEAAADRGFRRVSSAARIRSLLPETAWSGWSKHEATLAEIIRSTGEGDERYKKILDFLGRPKVNGGAGLGSVDSQLAAQAKLISTGDLYLPHNVADVIDEMASPYAADDVKVMGNLLQGWRNITAVLRGALTVGHLAFHGRNALSNLVQGNLVHGAATLTAQVDGIKMLTLPAEAKMTIGKVTRPAGEWREEARRLGVLTDFNPSDMERGLDASRVVGKRVAAEAAIGALVGGTAAAADVDPLGGLALGERDISWKEGAALGAMAGFAGGSFAQFHGSRPMKAMKGAKAEGATTQQAISAGWDEFVEESLSRIKDRPVSATVSFPLEGVFIAGGGVGQAIENQARFAGWIAGMKKGMSAKGSADLVNTTFFDYSDLTKFESGWMRLLFPFYTWNKKNALELQPYLIQHRPTQYRVFERTLAAAAREFGPTEEDMATMDEHLKYRFAVMLPAGKLLSAGFLPQEAMMEWMKWTETPGGQPLPAGVLQMLNPVAKFSAERLFGQDLFYKRPIKGIRSARDVRDLGPRWPKIEKALKEDNDDRRSIVQAFVGFREFKDKRGRDRFQTGWYWNHEKRGWEVDAEKGARAMHLLRNIPYWRFAQESRKVLAETFVAGTMETARDDVDPVERLAQAVLGINTTELRDRDDAEALFHYLTMLRLEEQIADQSGLTVQSTKIPKSRLTPYLQWAEPVAE